MSRAFPTIVGLICGSLLFPLTSFALTMAQCSGSGAAVGYNAASGFNCTQPLGGSITHIGKSVGISITPGLISLGTKSVTVTGLAGVLPDDICVVTLNSTQAITAGLVLAGCRASGTGQVDVIFSTPIALGITVGAISVDIGWLG